MVRDWAVQSKAVLATEGPQVPMVRSLYLRRLRAALIFGILMPAGLGLFSSDSESQVSAVTANGTDFVVVQPGDSYWSIARDLQPNGDIRPLVSDLRASNNDEALVGGQRLYLP